MFFEQVDGAAMGSLASPIVANLFIEKKALCTATRSPRLWLRYVDDTSVIQREEHIQDFLEPIKSVDLRFTV